MVFGSHLVQVPSLFTFSFLGLQGMIQLFLFFAGTENKHLSHLPVSRILSSVFAHTGSTHDFLSSDGIKKSPHSTHWACLLTLNLGFSLIHFGNSQLRWLAEGTKYSSHESHPPLLVIYLLASQTAGSHEAPSPDTVK